MKMSKDLLAKYCQNNNERFQKKLLKDIKVFLKKKNIYYKTRRKYIIK